MIEQDTIKLLRECDAGIKMGISSIEDILDDVKNEKFKGLLEDCRNQHTDLADEMENLLNKYNDDGKEPTIIAKTMSKVKTNVMISYNKSDNVIADLITDGCNNGVKVLHRYLNKYKAADEKSKDIAKRLINFEEKLVVNIREFL